MVGRGAEALLEREDEISQLRRAVGDSWDGVGRLVLIEGPAGIGKTSLVAAAREMSAEVGMNVRAARGAELEQSFAFGVVRQLFDSLLAGTGDAQRGRWLTGAAELAAPLFDPRAAMEEPDGDAIYPRLHGLYWLCSNISRERPLALLIDDAQWADEPSLAFLGFLARRLEELPILLAAAIRVVEADAPESLQALRVDPAAHFLKPRGLSADSIKQVLSGQIGGEVQERFARACHEATAGNPFLVGELVRELQEGGVAPLDANAAEIGTLVPQRVADAVLARLRRVSPSAPSLARALAILGDGASVRHAAALAEVDEQTAIETAAAMRAGNLLGDEGGLSFAHPIIRAAIYHSVLPAERPALHAQAARLLHERGATPERIAAQILLADEIREPWMAEQLRLAAASALALGAPRSAASYLQRALALEPDDSDRAPLLARLGHAEVLAGLPEAEEHLWAAVHLAGDADERAEVAIELAQLFKYTARAPRAVELLSDLPPAKESALNERVQTEILSAALISDTAHELLADRLAALKPPAGYARSDRERLELVVVAFERLLANRPKGDLLELLARAGPGPAWTEERILLPPGLITAAAMLSYCDQLDEAEALCNAVIERSRKRGSPTSLSIALPLRAQLAYRRGDLSDALADAEAAFQLASDAGAASDALGLNPLATIANVAVEQQRADSELQELLARTDRTLDRDTLHVNLTLQARARLLLALGRAREALDQLLEFARLPPTFATRTPAFIAWRSDAALIMHHLGDRAEAERLAAEEVVLAQQMGAPRAIGIALRAHGLVQDPSSIEVLREAARVLERSPARLEHARALVDLGATMRRTGERAASRTPLRDGHDLAVLCGAARLAERARQEIAASGARAAPVGTRGVASLTPSERRVAELAAQGSTNRDIAQTLFITEKTVETHLGHVYDKLGVRSRHSLRDLLPQPDARASPTFG